MSFLEGGYDAISDDYIQKRKKMYEYNLRSQRQPARGD
jgi:hypothetical protein